MVIVSGMGWETVDVWGSKGSELTIGNISYFGLCWVNTRWAEHANLDVEWSIPFGRTE